MAKTSAINLYNLNLYVKLDTNLRLIINYDVGLDIIITRIDVKIENRQYCVALTSGYPKVPEPGQQILPDGDLITPNKSVEGCLNIKVNKEQLVVVLKELVSDLENDGKE